ncbi:uncharacterized protein LOC131406876 [Diceros bicornis minor]|uniref:uncharacterized protein LOC131406876 n=1 Tax=Diceros bicornis minor TaxID=77932 RepID=UPI0026EFB608|nr:uncharacterized protein LOC131406876 [Diceros bicornis minor]
MGPRAPAAAGSAQARPRRPHANRLPAPTPLPPRARRAASCAPGPRARCCRCRPPPACAPAAPASSGRPPAAGPRAAFRGRAGRRRAAFRHSGRPGAPRSSAAAPRVRAARCTCSSAGPQPTLGQHSRGETNPSAARRASGPARRAPAAASQTPASCAAASASPAGAHGLRAGAAEPPRRGARQPQRIRNRSWAPRPLTPGEVKRGTASGMPGDAHPGRRRLQAGSGGRAGAVCAEPARTGWAVGGVAPPTNT